MKNLPKIHVSNNVKKKIGNNKFLLALVDIFDDDFWSSKVSIIGNSILIFLISVSTIEVILDTEEGLSGYKSIFRIIDISTSIIFTFEIFLRVLLARYKSDKYKGIKGLFRYLFSFYGIIDLVSILPFWGILLGFSVNSSLKIIRIFRIWRIVRFIPAFEFIGNAVRKKSDEILVTLLGVVLLSTTISAFLFYTEKNAGFGTFTSILDALLWSIGKYTGDYGAIAVSVPETYIGRFLATINGILGIALFALPAGLLGSAFIDELVEQKSIKQLKNRVQSIEKYILANYKKNRLLFGHYVHWRYVTFDSLQARLLLTDDEIIECVRNSDNLRFRSMKSAEDMRYNDIKIVERFEKNSSYGCKLQTESKYYIINPLGASERCISHFTYSLAESLNFNYNSREIRIKTKDGKTILSSFSEFYANYENIDTDSLPDEFNDFMGDLMSISSNDYVFVIGSSASGRADFIVDFGNKVDETDVIDGTSTITDKMFLERFIDRLEFHSKEYRIIGKDKRDYVYDFSVEKQTIDNYEQKWIGKTIHRLTGANVITLYVNIRILIGLDPYYYAGLGMLLKSMQEAVHVPTKTL